MNRPKREPPKYVQERNKLIEKAKGGDQEAIETLKGAPYFLKIYTEEERDDFLDKG